MTYWKCLIARHKSITIIFLEYLWKDLHNFIFSLSCNKSPKLREKYLKQAIKISSGALNLISYTEMNRI